MVNEDKLRIMTRLATYEKNIPEKEQKEGGYFKSDYIRSHLILTIWSYSVAYFLLMVLIALYHFDNLVASFNVWKVRNFMMAAVAVYVLLMVGCVFFTIVIYSKKYAQLQKKRREYYNELKNLEEFYVQSREGGNG